MTRSVQRYWTPEKDDLLRELVRSGESLTDIAEQIKRSPGSVRIRASRLKIALTKSGKLTACPAWLKLAESRTSFIFVPDRAKVVRRVFEMSVAGLGGYTIAKRLNANDIPTFGPSPKWDQSTIHNMLRNRATIGEYQPRRYATAAEGPDSYRDRKGIPAGDPIRDYYPAVIDEALFNKAQEARRQNLASGRGRKGRLITNLFAGIPICAYCSAPVKFHSNGRAKSLICSNVIERKGCYRTGWSYRNFENSFFELLTKLQMDAAVGEREREEISDLLSHISALSGPNVYDARLALSIRLRFVLAKLKVSSSGSEPIAGKPDARIRRDQPGRSFEMTLRNGSTHKGFAVGK
jgi:hypothetical protein